MNNGSNLNQQAAIDLAHNLCPSISSKVDPYITFLFGKVLKFETSDQVAKYACLQMRIGQVEYPNLLTALALSRVIGGVLGVVGSVLALIIFTRPEYKNCVTMTYHKFINAIEIVNGFILIHDGFEKIYDTFLWQSSTWVYISVYFVLRCRGSILFIVNMLVLWIACERITACLANSVFNKLNTNRVAWTVIALAVITATVCALPNGFSIDYFYNNSTSSYSQIDSIITTTQWYKNYSVFYAIFTLTHALVLLTASVTAVIGFMSMIRRKRKLMTLANVQTSSDQELMQQISNNLQLCILQMCETLPFTVNEIIVAAYLINYQYVVELFPARTAPFNFSYPIAVAIAVDNEIQYILQFLTGFGVVLSHCFRFYLYLIFSNKARRCFWSLIAPGSNSCKVVPISGGSVGRSVAHRNSAV